MKEYWFWIRRTHSSPYERIRIEAVDSHAAVAALPSCVTWDFFLRKED